MINYDPESMMFSLHKLTHEIVASKVRKNSLIFGEPIPVLSETDIDILYGLDGKIDNVLTQLNGQQSLSMVGLCQPEHENHESLLARR